MSTSIESPPIERTHLGRAMSEASRNGGLVLQHCTGCGEIQYPPRELCKECLGVDLDWKNTDSSGVVVSASDLHSSLEPYYQQSLPWKLASVKLDCGPVVLAHNIDGAVPGEKVDVVTELHSAEATAFLVIKTRAGSDNN